MKYFARIFAVLIFIIWVGVCAYLVNRPIAAMIRPTWALLLFGGIIGTMLWAFCAGIEHRDNK